MKNLASALTVLLLTLCLWPVSLRAANGARATIVYDLDNDGRRESIVLDDEKEQTLSIRRNGKLLWQGVTTRWKPWKLMVADVDGDGKSEIILGVYKATRFFPKPHNCLFIYGWDGRRVFPKWLGSSLSKPFTDFTFADFNGDGQDELVALETRRDALQSVAVYSWNGFGFTLDWQRGAWSKAKLVTDKAGSILVEADGERIALGKGE
jgi:hypothetical protein